MKNITYLIIAFTFSFNTLIGQNNPIIKLDWQIKNIVIDNICKALNKNYVLPDKAKLMSDFIKEQNKKGKYDLLANPNELASQVFKDIRSVYDDNHIRIAYDPQLEKDIINSLSSKKGASNVSDANIAKDKNEFLF